MLTTTDRKRVRSTIPSTTPLLLRASKVVASRVASPFGPVTESYIQRHTTLYGQPQTFDETLRSAMMHWLEWNSFLLKVAHTGILPFWGSRGLNASLVYVLVWHLLSQGYPAFRFSNLQVTAAYSPRHENAAGRRLDVSPGADQRHRDLRSRWLFSVPHPRG